MRPSVRRWNRPSRIVLAILATVFLLICLGCFAALYLAGQPDFARFLLGADGLYFPALFFDLFQQNGSLANWYLAPPGSYFFPDFGFYFLAYLATRSPYLQIVAFGLVQMLFLFFAVWVLAGQVRPQSSILAKYLQASAVTAVAIALALSGREPFVLLTVSGFHYGSFIVTLVFLAAWLRYYDASNTGKQALLLAAMGFLAAVTTLSDTIFLVHVVAPLIATSVAFVILEPKRRARAIASLVLIPAASVVGYFSYYWLVYNNTRYPVRLGTYELWDRVVVLGSIFWNSMIKLPLFGVAAVLYVGISLYVVYSAFAGLKKPIHLTGLGRLWLFSLAAAGATVCAIIPTELPPLSARYLIPVMLTPVALLVFVAAVRLRRSFDYAAVALCGISAFLSLSIAYRYVSPAQLRYTFRDAEIDCIDGALEKYGVANGVAQYFDAKPLQLFSRLPVSIAQVAQHPNALLEQRWVNTARHFRPAYDFAVVSDDAKGIYGISAAQLAALNGKPRAVEHCQTHSVHIFGKEGLRIGRAVDWSLVAAADFDGDRKADLLWRDENGDTELWRMDGVNIRSKARLSRVPEGWSLAATADLDGDGKAEIIWRDARGSVFVWLMTEGQVSQHLLANLPRSWDLLSAGDFDGDGKTDLTWRNVDGSAATWFLDGVRAKSALDLGTVPTSWSLLSSGDFDGDGTADLIWRDRQGNTEMWLISGGVVRQRVGLGAMPVTWSVIGTGDFNADGRADLLWRDLEGSPVIWLLDGPTVLASHSFEKLANSWSVRATQDFDGDGRSDLFWRDVSEASAIWFMNGLQISSAADLPSSRPQRTTVRSQ